MCYAAAKILKRPNKWKSWHFRQRPLVFFFYNGSARLGRSELFPTDCINDWFGEQEE